MKYSKEEIKDASDFINATYENLKVDVDCFDNECYAKERAERHLKHYEIANFILKELVK